MRKRTTVLTLALTLSLLLLTSFTKANLDTMLHSATLVGSVVSHDQPEDTSTRLVPLIQLGGSASGHEADNVFTCLTRVQNPGQRCPITSTSVIRRAPGSTTAAASRLEQHGASRDLRGGYGIQSACDGIDHLALLTSVEAQQRGGGPLEAAVRVGRRQRGMR